MADRDQNWILALSGAINYCNKKISGGIDTITVSDIGNNTYLNFKMTDGTSFKVKLQGVLTDTQKQWVVDNYQKLAINSDNELEYDGKPLENVIIKNTKTDFPTIGKSNVLYISENDNVTYRWDDTTTSYIKLSGGSGELDKDLTSSISVGGISANTTFTQGTTYDDMWDALLNPYQKPIINTFTLNPNTATYEIGTVITSLVLNASITKKSKPLTFVKFYDGSTLLDNQTTGVTNGGNFSYTYSLNNDDTDMTLKVECSDGDNTVNKTTTVKFARNTFYGTDSATNAPYTTSADIRALSGKKLGAKSGDQFVVSIPVGSKKVVIAIPSTLNISSVKYVEGLNAEVKNIFTVSTINVEGNNGYTGIDYKVYEYAPVSPFSAICHYTVVL